MSNGNKKKKISTKGLILRLIALILYLLIFLYLANFFIEKKANPTIIIISLLLVFLTTIAPFFLRKRRRSLYSKMFPDRRRRPVQKIGKHKRKPIIEKEPRPIQPKIFQAIDLDFEYRKPLISNCENCGNILPSFVKEKCPFCQEQV